MKKHGIDAARVSVRRAFPGTERVAAADTSLSLPDVPDVLPAPEIAPAPQLGHLAGPPRPTYWVPPAPQAGWTAEPSRRRAWVSRGILLCILVVQALLSLRLRNTAFEDEALYLYAGHLQLDHLLHGTPAPTQFTAYFSGSPALYPVLGAAMDSAFGLAGARALGMAFMLATTALLYSMSRLQFNERAALCAAAAFAVTQSTLFLSNFATYDPPAIFLLALAAWLVVRFASRRVITACFLAAPVLALAVAVKYATLMYLPIVVVLAVLSAARRRGAWALVSGVLLTSLTAAAIVGAAKLAGGAYLDAVGTTTTGRALGTSDPMDLLRDCLEWGGVPLALAILGSALYVRQARLGEAPGMTEATDPGRLWRLALSVALCGAALLAPAYQMYLHTSVSLHKHIGYGLLFAAPMAGVGITRLVGAHFRNPQLGILLWVIMLVLGLTQSQSLYHAWPDSSQMVATLKSQLRPGGRYLVEASSVPRYYLRKEATPKQWISTYRFTYTDRKGRRLSGERGYRAAIAVGYFDVIVLDGTVTPELNKKLAGQLRTSAKYRLLARLPYRNSYGTGHYQLWVKRRA